MTLNQTSARALSYIGAVRPGVRHIAEEIVQAAQDAGHQLSVVWGYNPASQPEHSAGTALDFMCDRAGGDWIGDYLWSNRGRLGLRWEIWRQRIRSTSPGKPGTWQAMADRGSTTQNHFDHVHANFWDRAYTAPAGGGSAPAVPASNTGAAPSGRTVYVSKLRRGQMDSDSVRLVQQALNKLHFRGGSNLPITGNYLDRTAHEAGLFQAQRCNDPADGELGPKQARLLLDLAGMRDVQVVA